MQTLFKDILIALSSCLYGGIVLHFLMTSKQNYIKNYKKVSIGFLIAIVVALVLYFPFYNYYFKDFPVVIGFLLFPFLGFIVIFYKFLRRKQDVSIRLFFEKKSMYFISFDNRFILSMSCNLLWQQLGLLFLFELLKDMSIPFFWIVVLFSLIVGLSHLYIFKFGKFLGYYFFCTTFIAGILFPLAITYIPGAIVYSYMFHWIFYLLTGALFFFLRKRRLIFV